MGDAESKPRVGLYVYAVPMVKHNPQNLETNVAYGCCVVKNETEARGIAVEAAKQSHPTFAMTEVLVFRVTDEAVVAAFESIAL